MATWAKIKILYAGQSMLGAPGSALTATSTAAGDYSAAYLYNMLETNMWKAANATDPHYLTYDGGAGQMRGADCLAILGHNLFSAGATVFLTNSNDNFVSDNQYVLAIKPASDSALFVEIEGKILINGGFELWNSGSTSAPDAWALSGGPSVVRDAVNFKSGQYGAALTGGGSTGFLQQTLQNLSYFQGKTITLGCWVKTSTANNGLSIYDGVSWSYSGTHPGDGTWRWLTVTKTISASAPYINVSGYVQAGQTGYFDGAVLREGSSAASTDVSDDIQPNAYAKRYWRLKITGMTTPVYMTLCLWGQKTELDYASASFDPYEQSVKASVNMSYAGYITGVHMQHTERKLRLRFEDADSTLYARVKTWWEANGLKNFFVVWENANNTNDVYLMRPDASFSNPLTNGGLYRDVTINLTGRKE